MTQPIDLAEIDARIAKPGDPDLDYHVTGLRILALIINQGRRITEISLTFDTSEAAGWWIDHETGRRFFPEKLTSVDITGGIGMKPSHGWLLDLMTTRLTAWEATSALITVTAAPGKWSLLYSPLHPDGEIVPFPRSADDAR